MLCSATSWLMQKKKQKVLKTCISSELKAQNSHNLKLQFPCIRIFYKDRNTIPHISSTII